jgi:hypothetical protein
MRLSAHMTLSQRQSFQARVQARPGWRRCRDRSPTRTARLATGASTPHRCGVPAVRAVQGRDSCDQPTDFCVRRFPLSRLSNSDEHGASRQPHFPECPAVTLGSPCEREVTRVPPTAASTNKRAAKRLACGVLRLSLC